MAYRGAGLALVLTWTCMSSTHLFAQSAPVVHWSFFNKQASACACHLFARGALQREGLTILDDSGEVLLANNGQVTAVVACRPEVGQVFVSAFSSDSPTAERIRNNVRADIVRAALFDTCP